MSFKSWKAQNGVASKTEPTEKETRVEAPVSFRQWREQHPTASTEPEAPEVPEAPAAPQPSTERSTPAQTGRLRPGWDVSDVVTAYQQAIRDTDSSLRADSGLSEIARTRQSPSAAAQTATDLESRMEQYSAAMDNTQRNMGAMTPALQQARAGVDQRQREYDGYEQKLELLYDTIENPNTPTGTRSRAIQEYNALLPYARQAAARLDNEVNTYNSLAGQAQQMEAQYNEALLNYQQALPEYDRISSRGNLDAKAFRSEGDKWSQRAKDLEAEANGTEALHPDFTRMTPEQVGEWQQNYFDLRTQAQEANAKASEYRRQEEAAQRRYQNYQYNQLLAGVEKYQTDPNWDKLAKADPEKMKPFGKDASTGIGLYRDSKYAIINGSEAALQDSISARADTWGAVSEVHLTKMNDREKAAYNYLYATKGKDAADAFLKELEPTLNARQRESDRVWWTNYAKEQPWGASAFSVLASPMKAVSLFGQAADLIQTGNIDQNAAYNKFSYVPSDLRGAVSEQIEKKWGKVGSFAYQTGMSMADFLFQSAITGEFFGASAGATGLAKLTKPALLIMGSGAAADTVIELRDRGVDSTRAMALGAIAGLAEIITENVSLENLLNPDKLADGVIRYVLKNMAAEGSEELGSDVINWAADALYDLISGQDEAEWKYQIRQLQKEGMGVREATQKVTLDMVKQAGLDALGGTLSGGVMAGAGAPIQLALNSNVGQAARAAAQATRADLAERNAPAIEASPVDAPTQIETPVPVSTGTALDAAVNKLAAGEALTQNDGRRILQDDAAMQALRDAGLVTETVRNDADGRQRIRQAVEQYAAQTQAETTATSENRAQETQEEQQGDITPAAEAPRPEGLRLRSAEETLTPAPERVNLLANANTRTEVTNNGQTEAPAPATAEQRTAPAPEAGTVRNTPAAESAGRQSTRGDGGRGPGLGRFLVQSFRANYQGARAQQQQNRRANALRAQAETRGDLTYFSGSEIASDGTNEKLGAYAPEDMWDDELRQTVQEYADKGVTLTPILGQIGIKDGRARAYVSADGKQMWVQIDHSRLSWQQLAAHEELHRELKVNPSLRAEIIRDLKSDPEIAKNYDRILRRYVDMYNKMGITDAAKIEEEMLADYRAGFDMLKDTIGSGVLRTKMQESIRATERRASDNGEVTVVDGVAMATNEASTVEVDPKPFDETSVTGDTSIETFPDWAKNYIKNGGDAQEIIDQLRRFTEQMVANDLIYGYVPSGRYAYNSEGPLRKNDEYVRTFDMDASCPRTFQFLAYRNKLRQMAGRPLTYNESIQLVELMRAYGQQIPCTYCYVENKRILLDRNYLNWFDYRNAVLSADTDEEARTKMYSYNPSNGALTRGATKQLAAWRQGDRSYKPSAVDVWTAMQTAKNSVFNYLDGLDRSGALSRKTPKTKIIEDVCKEFGVTEKAAQDEVSDYVSTWIYDRDAQVPHQYATLNDTDVSEIDQQALVLHRTAMSYANSASSARGVDNYMPYTDQLKNFEQFKKRIMAQGGIRKHSSNDFRIDYVQDYFLFFADLAAGKWTGHTYTKNADYVRIFGRTGDRINISVAFTEENGKLRENWQEGMGWRDAQQLRRDYYDNVGVMAMVTSNAQLSYALNADWIDMIIPFHSSGLDKAVWYDLRGWFDFTSKQHERFLNADQMKRALRERGVEVPKGAKAQEIKALYDETFRIKHIVNEDGKEIVPHFLPGSYEVNGQTVPGHNNDIDTYMKLCREYGVVPRFQGILVDDGKGNQVDVTEHPNYMKLVKETARTETEQKPIQFNFNEYDEHLGMSPFEYAMQRMEEEARNGGYENTTEDPYGIVDEFAREYLGKNKPLTHGVDAMLTERAHDHKEQLAEMQAEEETRQAQVVQDSIDEGARLANIETLPDGSASREVDPDILRELNKAEESGDVIHLYRTMEIVEDENGRKALRSPMADTVKLKANKGTKGDNLIYQTPPFGYVDEDGNVYDLNDNGGQTEAAWFRADEHPEAATMANNEPWVKGKNWASTNIGKSAQSGSGNTGVAYNPYNHASNYVLNDQFTTAYKRPGLVTVEVIVPKSEANGEYWAEYAKDPVGWADWKSGEVANAIKASGKEPRRLFLSRWMKVARVVPAAEVADRIVNNDLKGTNVKIPANVITPELREALSAIDANIIGAPQAQFQKDYYKLQGQDAGNTSIENMPSESLVLRPPTERGRGRSTRGPKEKVSRVRTHAFELGGLYNEVEAQMAETQPEEFTYDPISEKRSMNEALGRLRKDFTGEAEKLSSSDQWGGSDLDTAMGILYQYRQIGRETGDYSLFNEWSHVIQQKGTKGGQFVQAFAKYSRTATYVAQKAAENLRETAGKLNPKQQKLIEGHVSDILGAIDNDTEAAARDAVEKSKGKKGLRLPGGNDTQRARDAENVIKQIHKIFSQQTRRNHGLPVEEWTKATGDRLAGRIASRLKEPGTKTQTTMQTILGDLVTFAQEHALPTQEARQHRTALDRITDYLNNREAYAEAWGEAKQVLRDMYADDSEKLDALESFLNATITYNGDDFDRTMYRAILEASDLLGMDKQDILDLAAVGTTESVINRIADEFVRRVGVDDATLRDTVRRHIENIVREGNVDGRLERMESEASRELDIKIQDLLRESRRTKADAANRIAQYLINDLGISGTDAAIAANHIAGHYMDQLQQRADRVVERMFAEKKTITKKQRDKLMDLIHLGGLTNANVEDAVVDALGIGKLSRGQQRQIMDAMAQFADTLDAIENDDLEGLRQLIRLQAAARGTKLSSLTEEILSGETDAEYLRNFATTQLGLIAADYDARSAGEKISTLQVISHLLNARTAMRNVTSNQIFDLVDSTANNVGLLSDIILSKITGQRTVGFEKSWASQAKRQGAVKGMGRSILEVALDVAPSDRNKSKYGTGGRRTFSMANSGVVGRILSRAEKIMGYELNTTDEFHKGSVMGETLESLGRFVEAGYMTEEEAAEFAAQEALYRSFQDDTKVGAMLAGLKDVLNIIGTGKTSGKTIRGLPVHDFGLGDLVVKYTQVPGALIHRAIEYSPVGYLKAFYHIAQLGNAKHRGESTIKQQRNAALALGRATTGSGLITLFTLLAKLGLLRRGDDEKNKDAAALKTSQGLSGTQINLTAISRLLSGESAEPQQGDVLHDIGFLEPLDSLMTIAALINNDPEIKNLNLYEMFRSAETAKKFVGKSLQGIWLALEDTSAMQTLSNIYSTIRYHDEENDLPLYMQIPIEIASSSLSGFVPAPIRQIAQATDTTYRDQYRSQDLLKQTGARVANAIPGLRLQLAPKLTPLGKDKTYQEPWLNALNALVNPGNINIYDTDEVRDELLKVYEETGDGSMLPARNAPYSISIGHESYTLTPDERTEYLRIRGQEETKFVESLLTTSWYRSADADTKAAFLNSAKNIANDIAKSQWAAERGITYHDTTYRKYLKMLADGTRYADVIKANNEDLVDTVVLGVPRQVWDDTKEAFNDIANSDISSYDKGVQQRALICDLELNDRQKLVVYGDLANTESREEQFRTVMDTGLSFNETAKIFDKYSEYKSEDETRASQDAKDFALWVDQRQDLTDEQKKVIKEQFKYWQMIPAEAERYEKYVGLGFEPEVASRIDSALSELQPLPGHDSVTNMQRAQAALGALGKNASQSDQMKIVESFYGGSTTNKDGSLSQWGKIKKVTGSGVTVDKTLTMVEDGSLDVYCKWMDSDQKKAGINSDTYIQTVKKYNDTHSEYDKETGKEIKGKTRKDKMISYIDGLNLSVEQKDSLYLMEYKESGLKDTPWHKGGSSGAGKTYAMSGLRLPTPERREPISSGLRLQSAPKAKPTAGGLKLR